MAVLHLLKSLRYPENFWDNSSFSFSDKVMSKFSALNDNFNSERIILLYNEITDLKNETGTIENKRNTGNSLG